MILLPSHLRVLDNSECGGMRGTGVLRPDQAVSTALRCVSICLQAMIMCILSSTQLTQHAVCTLVASMHLGYS